MRVILLLSLFGLSACGIQGDLYLPEEPAPTPERTERPYPYPSRPPEEQTIMPDAI